MKTWMKIAIWFVLILSCVSWLGCHTVRGVGEDIEGAGKEIEKAGK